MILNEIKNKKYFDGVNLRLTKFILDKHIF